MTVSTGPWKDDNRTVDSNNVRNGSGGGGDGMDVRVARLESDVEYIKRDIAEIKTDMRDSRSEFKDGFNICHADNKALRDELKHQLWAFIGIIGSIVAAGLWGFWHLSENAHESTNQVIEVKQELKSINATLEEIKKAVAK